MAGCGIRSGGKSVQGDVYKRQTGKYVVDVDAASASGMFRVVNCVLTSVGGKMQADITLSGTCLLYTSAEYWFAGEPDVWQVDQARFMKS